MFIIFLLLKYPCSIRDKFSIVFITPYNLPLMKEADNSDSTVHPEI